MNLAKEVIDIEIPNKDTVPSTMIENEQQPTTSNTQLIQKQHSVEVSSSKQTEDKDMDIKEKYKEIKAKMRN